MMMVVRRRTVSACWGLSLLVAAALCLGPVRAQKVECDKVAVHLYPHSQKLTKPGTVVVNSKLNSSLVLTCSSDGIPDDFTWCKNGQEIPSASSSEYRIDAVKSSDGGDYRCLVDVKVCGVKRKSNNVVINTPPTIAELPGEPQVVEAGSSFTLNCLASGWPAPHVQWSVKGQVVQEASSSYTVPSAQLTDSGDYTCTATNSRGSVSSVYTVTVQGHPATKGHNLKQDAQVGSTTNTTDPDNKRGGSLGSATFIAIIAVCVLLAFAMIVVVIIVSM